MEQSKKYGRSLHAGISLGTTSDDRFMPKGYVETFAQMEGLVLTEKLDGQNNCFTKYGVFARSHLAPTIHPWDKPMRERWQLIKNDLGSLEVFGENMYGIHSIGYRKLTSYFYVFAIREKGRWLSWEEVKFYAALLDFPVVPAIAIKYPLRDFMEEHLEEEVILRKWLYQNLGMDWEESVQTSGLLGGYDVLSGEDCSEGFVVRNKGAFAMQDEGVKVASNEFNQLFKLVRKGHVKTDVHWTKNWQAATLINYKRHKWEQYAYLSKVKK